MKEIKNIWMYTRRRGSDAQLELQVTAMERSIAEAGHLAAGISHDDIDNWLFVREGLKQALDAVKTGKADAVMVTRLTNISHSAMRRKRFLKKLRKHGAYCM